MIEINDPQGSPGWFKVRQGIPTGSCLHRIITPSTGKYAAGADAYAAELIAEAIGWHSGFHGSPDTERGHRLESQALRWLRMRYGYKTREVGFCLHKSGLWGASPDGITEQGYPVEVKSPDIHTFLKWRIDGELPSCHKAQIHSEMIITRSDRCIFVAYADHAALDNWMIEVPRDGFTDQLEGHIQTFTKRLRELQEEILGEEFENYIHSKLPK